MADDKPSDSTPPTPEASSSGSGSGAGGSGSTLTPAPAAESSWKIDSSVIPHMESALLKSAVGATVGGVVGIIFFRSGKGWRMASMAAGVGVACGSAVERYVAGTEPKSLFSVEGLW